MTQSDRYDFEDVTWEGPTMRMRCACPWCDEFIDASELDSPAELDQWKREAREAREAHLEHCPTYNEAQS